METEYIDVTIEKTKKIALIAHDGKKAELLDWASRNKEILQSHFLHYLRLILLVYIEQRYFDTAG